MTDLYGDNYYKAIEKYFPEGKFVNPKKNLPKIPGKTILKRAGLAGIVYQLAEYITDKLEPETPENARFFPGEAGSVEARENYRRQAIENNLTKMEYSDDGTIKMSMGANVNLTDHIPYKVEVKDASNIPDAPGAAKKYKYVDPYDDIYGAIADDK